MSRWYALGFLTVAVLTLGGWALAQQATPAAKEPTPASPQYMVSTSGETAVLLETTTGKTWVLHRSVYGDDVWLLAKRIDTREEVHEWRNQQAAEKQLIAERARIQR